MKNNEIKVLTPTPSGKNRRQFLKISGMAIAGSGLLLACNDDDDSGNVMPPAATFDLGAGDLGVLNYAYALEQLEAAFYTNVLDGSYWAGAEAKEKKILEDLYNHEINHREFFKAALSANFSADVVLPSTLEFNFADIDFNDRDSVLSTAQLLEDTGVSAYNGAGKLIETVDYLVIAGKIVSIEARHAAAIRSIRGAETDDYAYFAGDDVITASTGLDAALDPSKVIAAAGGFFVTPFTANMLP
ncbi:MAG: ferritin-like domain-containing protein [Leeuwenhoekiella sp.]